MRNFAGDIGVPGQQWIALRPALVRRRLTPELPDVDGLLRTIFHSLDTMGGRGREVGALVGQGVGELNAAAVHCLEVLVRLTLEV